MREVDGKLSFSRWAGCSVEGWKDGNWSIFEGEDIRDLTEKDCQVILYINRHLYDRDDCVPPAGGEIAPSSDIIRAGHKCISAKVEKERKRGICLDVV